MNKRLAARILARRYQFRQVAAQAPASTPTVPLGPIGLDPRFPQQNKFILDTADFIDAQCTRRAGKSSGLAIRFFNTMNRYPGATCRYLALTGDSARDIMWPVLEELDEKYKIGLKFIPSRLTVINPVGGKLRLYGADMKNFVRRLRGNKAPGIAVDEAQEFGSHLEHLIDDVLTPMMADFLDAWLAVTGTPGPVPNGYFFDVSKLKKYGYSHHEWSLFDNPHLPNPQAFVERLVRKKQWEANHPTLLREYYNKWVVDLEALWIKYKSDINDFDQLPKLQLPWNYILGVDIGFKDADALAVLAWSQQSPITYLVEEIVRPKQDITALAGVVKELMTRYSFHKMVIDAGALGKKITEELINRHSLPFVAAEKARKQENAEFLNGALRLGHFKARAENKTEDKTSAMGRFAQDSYLVQIDWDKSTPDKIVVKKAPHSDIMDAVLYAFKESPAYTYQEAAKLPEAGSDTDLKRQEDLHLQAAIEQVKREQAAKTGKGDELLTWNKDKKGVPDWNKW